MVRRKRKQFPVKRRAIDLHGFTFEQAENSLYRLLSDAQEDRTCWVKVITGRGLNSPGNISILKKKIPGLLKRRKYNSVVVETRKASSEEGGEGAIMVRLRARQDIERYT